MNIYSILLYSTNIIEGALHVQEYMRIFKLAATLTVTLYKQLLIKINKYKQKNILHLKYVIKLSNITVSLILNYRNVWIFFFGVGPNINKALIQLDMGLYFLFYF